MPSRVSGPPSFQDQIMETIEKHKMSKSLQDETAALRRQLDGAGRQGVQWMEAIQVMPLHTEGLIPLTVGGDGVIPLTVGPGVTPEVLDNFRRHLTDELRRSMQQYIGMPTQRTQPAPELPPEPEPAAPIARDYGRSLDLD